MCPIIVIVWRQQDDLGHLNQTAPVREGDDSAIIRFVLESSFFFAWKFKWFRVKTHKHLPNIIQEQLV